MDIEKLEILDRLRELTQADLDEMDYDKVWIDYEDGTGEWALVCNGYIYSIDTLEGAGFEFAEYMRGEKLEPNGYKVYRCPPDGAALEAAIALSTLLAENEELKSKLYDGEGVNLVDYWMQQAQIEGNGHRNCQAENEKLRAELEQVKRERDVAIGRLQRFLWS